MEQESDKGLLGQSHWLEDPQCGRASGAAASALILVEIGFDVINPIQPECMDPIEIKRRWGERITLHGCISIQRTLPFGSVDDVRREVETLIRQCGYNGGLVLLPSNNIQPDTPIENVLACYHTARDFDVRTLDGRPG